MSALDDNKNFISSVFPSATLNFDTDVFGVWVSVFENVNASFNGYSFLRPIVQDITSIDYPITGKVFSLFNFEGKYPDVKFFIVSGKKGLDLYESSEVVADISNSFISGYKPLVIMPDMDFSGKIYRKQEITGLKKSLIGNDYVLSVSGEDWQATTISPVTNNTDIEYAYYDSGYSGYSNEVVTRYKFLYDDVNNSENIKNSVIDIPTQLEPGCDLRYRICRKSDPLGVFYTPELTYDGKMIIDYSKFNDEVSGSIFSSTNYKFEPIASFTFGENIFTDFLLENEVLRRPVNDATITGLEINQSQEDGKDFFNFQILPTGSFSDIYKISFGLERFNSISKDNVVGYVLTGINTGNGSTPIVINLGVNSGVYPRVIQSSKYNSDELLILANTDELIFNEEVAQETAANVDYSDEKNLVSNLEKDMKARVSLINELLSDSEVSDPESSNDGNISRRTIDDLEKNDLNSLNATFPVEKFILPLFSLPKKTVDRDYYSNYLNSGEKYVAVPFNSYNSSLDFIYHGDNYGQMGYYIDKQDDDTFTRTVINSTCNGVYINKTGFCKGDTAIYANMPYLEDIKFSNGLETQIPSNGIIKKINFDNNESWQSAVNYFYENNYLSSCDIYPTDSVTAQRTAFNNAFSKALSLAKNDSARIFVERDVYVKPYDLDQIGLFNSCFNNPSVPNPELTNSNQEKLYGVQILDTDFAKANASYYYALNDYEEKLTFDSIVTYKDTSNNSIISYGTGESFGTVYVFSSALKPDEQLVNRLEYVTGSAFTYNGLTNFISWNGNAGNSISIASQDQEFYSYHLYGYNNNSDVLTFFKSDILSGETASVGAYSKALVLKFNKKNFSNSSYNRTVDKITYTAIDTSVADSSGQLLNANNVFFNIKQYNYTVSTKESSWFSYKQDPYNDDNYGADNNYGLVIPRFFEDSPDETRFFGEILQQIPNGTATSKNYAGKVVSRSDLNAFANGCLNNTLIIKEKNQEFSYENDFVLNYALSDGKLFKDKALASTNVPLSRSKRLKISRIQYNFFVKDLVLIGDAGFPYSVELNTGWEYKLQYKTNSSNWLEMELVSDLNTDSIVGTSSFLDPFFYKNPDLSVPFYLSMVAFKTNLSRFKDDSNYEFRIVKYEKLISPSSTVDILKKVNFFPVRANWTADNKSTYYNVYQIDSGNNYSLLKTENLNSNFSYVVPDVKQQYFDLGLANYPVNGSGYYNIVVSGVLPQAGSSSSDISGLFNNSKIGDDDANGNGVSISTFKDKQFTSGYNAIPNVTYTPLINFNNPESKESNFTINANYNGYYFVTNGKNATASSLPNGFECYILNTGSPCSFIDSTTQTINTNSIIAITGYPNKISPNPTLSSLPSTKVKISDGEFLVLSSNATIEDSSDITGGVIVNDSSSDIVVTYSNTVTIKANKSSVINISSSVISKVSEYDNINYNPDLVYTNEDFVNLNYQEASLLSKNYTDLGIYNYSSDSLSINNGAILDPDSFYLVNWNGASSPSSTPTLSKKDYFDSIRIYIKGNEQKEDSIYFLNDDTDIIISHFGEDVTGNVQPKSYIFLKNDAVTRVLNIKLINGSDEILLPRGSQDFKLTVSKSSKDGIIYSITYPSSDFNTYITSDAEQLVVVKTNNTVIDIGYIESALKSNAFVYFVNKSETVLAFQRNFKNELSLGANKIARVVLEKGSGKASIVEVENYLNHFSFTVDPATHLINPSGVDILNLQFCDTQITAPAVSSLVNRDCFLLLKNRFSPNLINEVDVLQSSTLLEKGKLKSNTRILRLSKDSVTDSLPTLSNLEVDSLNIPYLFGERTKSNSVYNDNSAVEVSLDVFYIKDTGLKSLTVSDLYNRTAPYVGKILTSSPRSLYVSSFDENSNYDLTQSDNNNFDFYFDQGRAPDGSFKCNLSSDDSIVYSQISENTESLANQNLSELKTNHLCINFAYTGVHLNTENVDVYPNRIVNNGLSFYPIYSEDEFFIAGKKIAGNVENHYNGSTTAYFYEFVFSSEAQNIIIQKPFSTSDKYVFKNSSSRPISIRQINNNNLVLTLNPNDHKTITTNGSTWSSANYNSSTDGVLVGNNKEYLKLIFNNQIVEIDSDHALKSLWESASTSVGVKESLLEAFISDSTPFEIKLENGINYSVIDNPLDSNTQTNGSSDLQYSMFCYGRKGPITKNSAFILNDFYLFCPLEGRSDYLLKNKAWIQLKSSADENPIVIQRKHVDIGSFSSQAFDFSALKDVTLIPFYREAITYYLPNLSYLNSDGVSYGELLLGKKFVFVNLVKGNSECPNSIYNYSDSSTTNLITLVSDAVQIFSVKQVGANYIWEKQTQDVSEILNCYPLLSSIKGVSDITCSNVTEGNEFLYLSNFKNFHLSLDSFKDKQFKNFYLFNSCSYQVGIIRGGINNSSLSSQIGSFFKIKYEGGQFSFLPMVRNGNSSFAETNIDNANLTENDLSSLYSHPPEGSYLKNNYLVDGQIYYSLFQYNLGRWEKIEILSDKNESYLSVDDLFQYSPNAKLFIYGSSVRNESDYIFDKYDLKINFSRNSNQSFYVFNNTLSGATVRFNASAASISIEPLRLVKISNPSSSFGLVEFCPNYETSKFFISHKKPLINYIQKQNTKIVLDAPLNRDFNGAEISTENPSSLLTLAVNDSEFCSVDGFVPFTTPSFFNCQKGYLLNSFENFSLITISEFLLIKPIIAISSAGHYLLSNSNVVIDFSPSAQDSFLINNTSSDIRVKVSGQIIILYRNTVLVINSSSHRYLKKSKSRDEFYSIFNLKTAVSTQREVGLVLRLEQHKQILPIHTVDYKQQVSYVKLYSKNGVVSSIYLNLLNYYSGKDIPNDSPQNVLAYELGVGHETIHKFLFFDPSENYYTLPGIVSGVEYLVDIDEGLFYNLALNENAENASFGSVRYMGKKYTNGETFLGAESSWYEVDYPTYVRVYKVVKEFPEGFDVSYNHLDAEEEGISSLSPTIPEDTDPLSKFKEKIISTIDSTLSTKPLIPAALCWIPENQIAFWLDPVFDKNIWQVSSIDASSIQKITLTEGSDTKELSFVKCVLKKNDLRSPVMSYYYDFYSALQERLEMSDNGDLTIGFDYNLNPTQKGSLKKNIQALYNKQDVLFSNGSNVFGFVEKNDLIPIKSTSDDSSQFKNSSFEIKISIEKLKSFPSFQLPDYSKNSTVQTLNI